MTEPTMSHFDWMIERMAAARGLDRPITGKTADRLAHDLLSVAAIMQCTVEDLAVAFDCPDAVAKRNSEKSQPEPAP